MCWKVSVKFVSRFCREKCRLDDLDDLDDQNLRGLLAKIVATSGLHRNALAALPGFLIGADKIDAADLLRLQLLSK